MRAVRVTHVLGWAGALIGTALAIKAAATRSVEPNPTPSATPATAPAPATQPARLDLPAILIPDELVEIYAKASGYVEDITVDYGSRVKRGDLLIRLYVPELGDELREAEATLKARQAKVQSLQAKANEAALLVDSARAEEQRYAADLDLANITLTRKKELYEGKAIPPQEYDVAKTAADLAKAQVAVGKAKTAAAQGATASAQADAAAAQADVAVAQADVSRIKTLIGYTTIAAPFDGTITRRNVNHGTFVRSAAQAAGDSLLTIAKVDVVRVVIDVPEANAPQVQAGTPATIKIRSLGDETIQTHITRTALSVRQDTRTMRAEIDLKNPDSRLLPGIYARALLEVSRP